MFVITTGLLIFGSARLAEAQAIPDAMPPPPVELETEAARPSLSDPAEISDDPQSEEDVPRDVPQDVDVPPTFSFPSPIGDFEYQAARGLEVGHTGLHIGGFATVEMDREKGSAFELQADNVSFLIRYEPISAFQVFAELEVGDFFGYEARGPVTSDVSFEVERLYGELSLDDPIHLRFGKFQTPVGRWNLVPAEPFVWTATDPVLLDSAFDEHQTGVALTGTTFPASGALQYWIYSQVIDPLAPSESPEPASRSVGGRLQFTESLEGWSIGSSFLATEKRDEWTYLAGFDAEIQWHDFELLTEFVYEQGAIPDRDLLGGYVQGRYALPFDFHLVSRYEYFDRLGSGGDATHIGDVGFAWQPTAWLLLKATYRFTSRETDDAVSGLASSISVVF